MHFQSQFSFLFPCLSFWIQFLKVKLHYCTHHSLYSAIILIWIIICLCFTSMICSSMAVLLLVMVTWPSTIFQMLSINLNVFCILSHIFGDDVRSLWQHTHTRISFYLVDWEREYGRDCCDVNGTAENGFGGNGGRERDRRRHR